VSDSGRLLRELSSMLGWNSCLGVAMLWAYFDESCQHDPATGHAIRMTMGGCISTEDKWKRLSSEWKIVLDRFNVSMFHMTDFEADRGVFAGWRDNRPTDRVALLNKLLSLMADHIELYLGTFVEVIVLGAKEKMRYQDMVQNTLNTANAVYRVGGGRMGIVFARHQSFSEAKAQEYSAILNETNNPNIGPVMVDDPVSNLPLQAADIFAYELSRHLRFSGHKRYPFMRIIEDATARGIRVETSLWMESFRSDPRMSGAALPGTMLPFPGEKA